MSDSESTANSWAEYEKSLAAANTINKAALFEALAAARITSVVVSFDGEGDSGQIQEIVTFVEGTPQPVPAISVRLQRHNWDPAQSEPQESSLADAIETLCFYYLSQEHGGWENNVGGYGDFTFRVADRAIDLEFSARYTDTTNYSHTS